MRCLKCGTPMEYHEAEPDVALAGGYVCPNEDCDEFIPDDEIEQDNLVEWF